MKKLCYAVLGISLLYILLIVLAYLPHATVPAEELAGPDSSFVTVDGLSIHYTKKGSGRPLVLVHGFAGSVFTWRNLIPLLSDSYTVYALDLPGFGLSDKPPEGCYELSCQADVLLDFLDALDIPSAALAGHSMGGIVATCAALAGPQKTESLILIEPGFYHGGAPAFLKYLFFPLDRLMARIFYTRAVRTKSLLPSYYDKSVVTDDVIEAYLQPGKTTNAVEAMAAMMREVGPQQYTDLSTGVTRPTLLVWSGNNTAIPLEDGLRLQKEIAGSELTVISACGHYVQEEKPQELASAMQRFLNR